MWRVLTGDDVLSVLNDMEKSAYSSLAAGAGQDVLSDIITTVTNHCRGYIGDNPANNLAAGVTLPERCHRPALHLIRKDLLTRLSLEVQKDRADDAKEALRFFERVAEGKVQIEQPVGMATDTSGANPSIDVVSSSPRSHTRESMSGL